MKKTLLLSLLFFFASYSFATQKEYKKTVKPTKNVILMIPDGCSLSVYSAARWFQLYNDSTATNLAIDPYVCGIVKTHNSNGLIGDSAPTTSTYMTGYLMQAGNISIYPEKYDGENLVEIDTTKTYQPLTTVLEAARIILNKSIGLVATVEFPHATPADCSAHHYNRAKYEYLAPQQVANKLDIVVAGGNSMLTPELETRLNELGTNVLRDDIEAFRNYDGKESIWALFNKREMPYDIDRNNDEIPSLAEMTEKAILRLSQNPNGFFLMVEGSQIDWAAHSNDIPAMLTEYLAFDKAVQTAIDFAKQNGETTVIILSDHGNSGMSIGRKGLKDYTRVGMEGFFKNIARVKTSARKLENMLQEAEPTAFKSIILDNTGIEITDEQLNTLLSSKNYKENDYMKKDDSVNLSSTLVAIMKENHYFGFTTGGHTGEDVLLATYHPNGDIPQGMNTNLEINQYLCDVIGLETSLDEITEEYYMPHQLAFDGEKYTIVETNEKGFPTLTVKKGKTTLEIPAFSSKIYVNKKPYELNSVAVYIDKNKTFYLPASLREVLNSKTK